MNTPTPHSDANAIESRQFVGKGADFVSLDFARILERELQKSQKHLTHKIAELNILREVAESEQDFHQAAAKELAEAKEALRALLHEVHPDRCWKVSQATYDKARAVVAHSTKGGAL